jgi:hypothetical protein
MLQLNEFIEIQEKVESLCEAEQSFFTDEQVDAAEFFDLKWNPVSCCTVFSIYNEAGEKLASIEFEDEDIALEYATSMFEFDEEDYRDLDSYAWANDGKEMREYSVMQDDGTSD